MQGLTIVGVSIDTDCRAAAEMVERHAVRWPQVCEGKGVEGEIAQRYNVRETPVYVVITPDGRIAARTASADRLEEVVRAVLPAAKPAD